MQLILSIKPSVKDRGANFDRSGGKRTGFSAWWRFIGIYIDWYDKAFPEDADDFDNTHP